MKAAHQAYRQSTKTSLTRIDMLIALYETTLRSIGLGLAAQMEGDISQFEIQRIRVYKCLVALLDGINVEQGEVARNIQQLCMYCGTLILSGKPDQWKATQRILQPLYDSFAKIRNTAVEMELSGEIPALSFTSVFDQATF